MQRSRLETKRLPHPEFPDKMVIYDGFCNLCSYWVGTILKHQPNSPVRLVSHLSTLGSDFLTHYQLDADDLISVIFYKDQTLYQKSDAVIEIAKNLKGAWNLLRLLQWLPKRLRDVLYMSIAKNRYRLFGRKHDCSIYKED